jgi:hypothetical protein
VTSSLPQERVFFEYTALGDIKKANLKQVTGTDLTPVSLRLVVETVAASPVELYDETISTGCTLKAKLQKGGEKSKLRLKCEVGELLTAFPNMTDEVRAHVEAAFPKKGAKHIKVDVDKGKVRITHNGEATDTDNVDVSCSVGTPG